MSSVRKSAPLNEVDPPRPPWRYALVLLTINLIMLFLALVSLVIMEIHQKAFWIFSYIMAAIDGVLCLWFIGFFKPIYYPDFSGPHWLRLIFHWLGFVCILYILSLGMDAGFSYQASAIVTLLVLTFSIYLTGLYGEPTFIGVAIVLAILGIGMSVMGAYVWLVIIPVIIIVSVSLYLLVVKMSTKKKG